MDIQDVKVDAPTKSDCGCGGKCNENRIAKRAAISIVVIIAVAIIGFVVWKKFLK